MRGLHRWLGAGVTEQHVRFDAAVGLRHTEYFHRSSGNQIIADRVLPRRAGYVH